MLANHQQAFSIKGTEVFTLSLFCQNIIFRKVWTVWLESNSFHQVPQKSFGVIDHLTALDAKTTAQVYHPPSLNDLVHNFMRDQHMRVSYPATEPTKSIILN